MPELLLLRVPAMNAVGMVLMTPDVIKLAAWPPTISSPRAGQ
jgi:hypothetical protein